MSPNDNHSSLNEIKEAILKMLDHDKVPSRTDPHSPPLDLNEVLVASTHPQTTAKQVFAEQATAPIPPERNVDPNFEPNVMPAGTQHDPSGLDVVSAVQETSREHPASTLRPQNAEMLARAAQDTSFAQGISQSDEVESPISPQEIPSSAQHQDPYEELQKKDHLAQGELDSLFDTDQNLTDAPSSSEGEDPVAASLEARTPDAFENAEHASLPQEESVSTQGEESPQEEAIDESVTPPLLSGMGDDSLQNVEGMIPKGSVIREFRQPAHEEASEAHTNALDGDFQHEARTHLETPPIALPQEKPSSLPEESVAAAAASLSTFETLRHQEKTPLSQEQNIHESDIPPPQDASVSEVSEEVGSQPSSQPPPQFEPEPEPESEAESGPGPESGIEEANFSKGQDPHPTPETALLGKDFDTFIRETLREEIKLWIAEKMPDMVRDMQGQTRKRTTS